jgi:hypothetical protein
MGWIRRGRLILRFRRGAGLHDFPDSLGEDGRSSAVVRAASFAARGD